MSKITWLAISQKPVNAKKNGVLENVFLHLYSAFGLKIQNTNGRKLLCNCVEKVVLYFQQPIAPP